MQNNEEIANALHNIAYYINKLGNIIYNNNQQDNNMLIINNEYDINIEEIKNCIKNNRENIHYIKVSKDLYHVITQKDGYKYIMGCKEELSMRGFNQIPYVDSFFYRVPLKINDILKDYEYQIVYFKEKED